MSVPLHLKPLRRRHTRLELIETMDDVPGAQLVDVQLPRDPAPPPVSRTLQGDLHPNLVRQYGDPDYPLRVASIPNARLMGSGAVVTSDGRLIMESLWDEDHFARDFDPPARFEEPARLKGVCASLISLWCDNYFHWMFNSLPRLAVLQASGAEYDKLIVPQRLKPFQRATLEVLGISEDLLVPYTSQHVQADVLVWAAPLAPINEPSSFLLEWVRRKLGTAHDVPWRRLYVSRKGGTRQAANEDVLLTKLEPLGFEFVLPETMSFADQVRLFSQARLAVGPHGSNFVNAIFSPHMSVLEFFQPAHVNWGVYSVLCAAGQDHWSIVCKPVRRLGSRRNADMYVPVELVLETIREIEYTQLSSDDVAAVGGS